MSLHNSNILALHPSIENDFYEIFESINLPHNFRSVSNLSFDQAVPKDYMNQIKRELKNQDFHLDIKTITSQLTLLSVPYFSFDEQNNAADSSIINIGQVVINKVLKEDLIDFFSWAIKLKFPIASIQPLAHNKFIGLKNKWNDDLSMKYNNCSSFNPRKIADKPRLSLHSYGLAIDINPIQNPCIYDDHNQPNEPKNGSYNPRLSGTFGYSPETNPVGKMLTKLLISKGWTWGNALSKKKDYHHFQKQSL